VFNHIHHQPSYFVVVYKFIYYAENIVMASSPNFIAVPPYSEMEKKKSPQLSFKRRTIVANSDSVILFITFIIMNADISTDIFNVGR